MHVTFHCHIHPYDARDSWSFRMRARMKKGTSTSELSSSTALVKATLFYEHILTLPVWQKFAKLSNFCPRFKKLKLCSFSTTVCALQYNSCSTHTYSDNLRKLNTSNDNEQLISEHNGSLIDLTTIAHHFPLSFYHTGGQSAEWTV